MKPMSLESILAAFDPIDREGVAPPDLRGTNWTEIDFLAWKGPHDPTKGYMVVDLPERPVGLLLRLHPSGRPGLCDLCHSIDRSSGASLAVVESWATPRMSCGIHICGDLDCSAAVRGLKCVYQLGETTPVGRRIERLQEHVERFARCATGLVTLTK